MIGVPAVLVLMQPNLGTATILVADGCVAAVSGRAFVVVDRARVGAA